MDKITRLFVKVREYQRGQTMAEYALIMAAVAVVCSWVIRPWARPSPSCSRPSTPSSKVLTGTMANFGQKNETKEDTEMDKITRLFVKVREAQKGQTMAEYALIMAAVAVVVFVGYQTMGTTITKLLSTVDTQL